LALIRSGFAAALGWDGNQRRGEFLVKSEEIFHALAVAFKWLRAIAEVNGAIQLRVGFNENRRHGERIVEIGQGRIGEPSERRVNAWAKSLFQLH
jgi:hypothetical protein